MSSSVPAPPTGPTGWLMSAIYARRGVLIALVLLAGFGLLAKLAWQSVGPHIAHSERYLLSAESVAITPPPAWVRDDVLAQSVRFGELSILDPPEQLEVPLSGAVTAHPWVRRVVAIRKMPPNRIALDIEYRRPIAVLDRRGQLLPLDADAVALPAGDLSANALRYLPRIRLPGDNEVPPIGVPVEHPAAAGATAVVAAFGPGWKELDLFELRADPTPDARAGTRFWNYQLISTGNTVVIWGAAPGFGPPDEPAFEAKLATLRREVAKHGGRLNSVAKGPALIDVRQGGRSFPRVVMKGEKRLAAKDEEDTAVIK